jgi:ABC-type sugar transport system substrate-binding protein
VLAVAGCGQSREWAPKQSTASRLAVVVPNLTDPYWGALRDAAGDAGARLGLKVDASAGTGQDDVVGMRAQIQMYAKQGADCVAVAPLDDATLIPDLRALNQRKIPLVTVSTNLADPKVRAGKLAITASIGVNDMEVGHVAGRRMVQLVTTGSIGVVRGGSDDQSGITRQAGLVDSLVGKLIVSAVRETPDDYAASVAATTTLLEQNPGLTGIFAVSDARGLGAARAVANLGLENTVTVISVGGSQAALQAVKDRSLDSVVARYPALEGELLARVCAKIRDSDPFPPRVTVPVTLVTDEDVDAALASFPEPPQPLGELLP